MYVPLFVRMGSTCLRFHQTAYYRDAGDWYIGVACKDGKLIADARNHPQMRHADGQELLEISEDEWWADNQGYVSTSVLRDKLIPLRHRVHTFRLK